MSSIPSPLKSPDPTTFQSELRYSVELAPLLVNPPFEVPSHSVSQPLVVSRSRKSVLPSPLKSPVAANCQLLVKYKLVFAPLLVKLPFEFPSQSVTQPLLF